MYFLGFLVGMILMGWALGAVGAMAVGFWQLHQWRKSQR